MQTNDSPNYEELPLKGEPTRQATLVEIHANHIIIQQLRKEIEEYRAENGGQECIRAFN